MVGIHCSGKHPNSSQTGWKQLCLKELGTETTGEPSPDGTYMLCRKEVVVQKEMGPSLEYVVVKKNPAEIVYRGQIMRGNVVWYSNEEVIITEKLGILGIRKENVRTFRVNVRTGRITETETPEKF